MDDLDQYAGMTDKNLASISQLLQTLEQSDTADDLYLSGRLEVRHGDGFRIGWISSYEDWWIFVPDASDD